MTPVLSGWVDFTLSLWELPANP